jgi:RimJ/RimL family protein N-acetyltransferase
MTVRIGLLADHPQLLVPLTAAYESEWPDWYGVHGDARTDLAERSRHAGLPIAFVAFEQDLAIGTIAIAQHSIRSHIHLSPWIIGFWVEPSHRNRGIGTDLLGVACCHAGREGISRLYAGTATASSLFVRENWSVIDTATTDLGENITVFSKTLRG